jgi:hypothetical protein
MTEKAADCGYQTRTGLCLPPVERVEKIAKSVGQRLFHHGLVDGPEISAKMRL